MNWTKYVMCVCVCVFERPLEIAITFDYVFFSEISCQPYGKQSPSKRLSVWVRLMQERKRKSDIFHKGMSDFVAAKNVVAWK